MSYGILEKKERLIVCKYYHQFLLEFFDEPCKFDYLHIRDKDSNGKELGKLCGDTIPSPITSEHNSLWINMITDREDNEAGFRASWELQESEPEGRSMLEIQNFSHTRHLGSSYVLLKKITHSYILRKIENRFDSLNIASYLYLCIYYPIHHVGCGGHITGIAGKFHSPNFPQNYPPEKTCIWKVQAPEGYYIQMQMYRFKLEEHTFCKYDSVQVKDGWDRQSQVLGTYCGTNPKLGTDFNNS